MNLSDHESAVEERLFQKAANRRIPIKAGFELTPLCNMNCRMCYLRLDKLQQEREHPLLGVDQWLKLAKKLLEEGTLFLLLTGGEPLLYPGFQTLYQELLKMGFIITLNTNGTLLTEEIADMFAADMPRRVNITLYGACNETYARLCGNPHGFDQTKRAVQLLTQRRVAVKLNASITRENKEDTFKLLDLADEWEVPITVNTYMFPCNRKGRKTFPYDVRLSSQEAAAIEVAVRKRQEGEKFSEFCESVLSTYETTEQLSEITRTMDCHAGKTSCWINWRGQMTPCVFMEQLGYDVISGEVDKAWKQIWEDCRKIHLSKECSFCRKRLVCGVCAASAWWENPEGTGFDRKPDYYCEYMEHIIENLKKEHMNKMPGVHQNERCEACFE